MLLSELGRHWGDSKPKGVILQAWKELGGFGGYRGGVWGVLIGLRCSRVFLDVPMHPVASGGACLMSDLSLRL